jgi:SnoaL-like polyketide cyclase
MATTTQNTRAPMAATTQNTSRTARLLALMKKGDDAFNSRDVAAMNATHHPDMIAHVTGSAEPIRGRLAHAAMMEQMFRIFPDVHVHNDPYPTQFGSGDWITVITRTTGTFTGEMILPDGKVIAPTGKAFDLDFSTTAKWDEDLLIEEFVFWDSALQAQQIGLA